MLPPINPVPFSFYSLFIPFKDHYSFWLPEFCPAPPFYPALCFHFAPGRIKTIIMMVKIGMPAMFLVAENH